MFQNWTAASLFPQLPAEIWHLIYSELSVKDLSVLDASGHTIRLEPEAFWKRQLQRCFVTGTVSRGSRTLRETFLDLANTDFSADPEPFVSARTSSTFVHQKQQNLVRSPYLVDRGDEADAEVWDFRKLAKYRFPVPVKQSLGCTFGANGDSAFIFKSQEGASRIARRLYKQKTVQFQIEVDADDCTIFCTGDRIDCTFVVHGLRKYYVDWPKETLVDVGRSSVNVANGHIYRLLGRHLQVCNLAGDCDTLDIEFDKDKCAPMWAGGNTRYLLISQSGEWSRITYLLDTVERRYASWSMDANKRDPDEYQILPDQIIMWYIKERVPQLEEFLEPLIEPPDEYLGF